jgi:hypothetical protein
LNFPAQYDSGCSPASCLRFLLLCLLFALAGCGKSPSGTGTAGTMTYNNDVRIIFHQSCRCHVDNVSPPSRLNLSTYADLMNGSASGRQVIPYFPDSSNLYRRVVRGEMPPTGTLYPEDIRTLRKWIAQGAKE